MGRILNPKAAAVGLGMATILLDRADAQDEQAAHAAPESRPMAVHDTHTMYEELTFPRGVQARTVTGGTVQHPVVIILDGVVTELTLADARKLLEGLTSVVAAIDMSEQQVFSGETGQHFAIGKTIFGMSSVPSKLPE